jgi:hypothetical protein
LETVPAEQTPRDTPAQVRLTLKGRRSVEGATSL